MDIVDQLPIKVVIVCRVGIGGVRVLVGSVRCVVVYLGFAAINERS